MDLVRLAVGLGILAVSLSAREAARALVAAALGDPGPARAGRATLNPWSHVEIFWSVLMPAILWVVSGGALVFGMARPLPLAAENLRAPGGGLAALAAAGALVNAALAAAATGVLLLLYALSPSLVRPDSLNAYFLVQGMFANVLLSVAHAAVPVPPMDAAAALRHRMGPSGRARMDAFEPAGAFGLLLGLGLLHAAGWLDPLFAAAAWALGGVTDPEYANALLEPLRGPRD